MSWTLGGSTIRRPSAASETNNTQYAQQRTLQGSIGRDYFGSNKRVWKLTYKSCTKTDYDTIYAVYSSYLSTGSVKAFVVNDTSYTVSANVHIDMPERGLSTPGSDYISDFVLTLTEV